MPSTTSTSAASSQTSKRVREMVYIAIFVVLITICSWLAIPTPAVEFTMQTFAIFMTAGLLGGRRTTWAVVVYLLLGAVGAPVFAHFTGGLGFLLGNTGGYLLGFFLTALLVWVMEHFFGDTTWVLVVSLVLGMVLLYAFGTAWFMVVYAREAGAIGLGTALAWCVLPFLPVDAAKLVLAMLLRKRLKGLVKL